jgi:hypothetical protein
VHAYVFFSFFHTILIKKRLSFFFDEQNCRNHGVAICKLFFTYLKKIHILKSFIIDTIIFKILEDDTIVVICNSN